MRRGLRIILAVGLLGAALVVVSRGFGADIGGDRAPSAREKRSSRPALAIGARARPVRPPAPGSGPPAVPSRGAYFGAYVGESTGRSLRRTEALIGRKLAIAHDYRRWDEVPFIEPEHRRLAAGGRILSLNWKPRRENDAPVPWAQIARGLQDARIDSVARQVKRFRRPLFLTFHHEPEDEVGVYGGMEDYARGFRRVVARFRRQGVRNVAFVWNVMGSANHYEKYRSGLYPGDDVVDWVAWDPYNWVDCHGRDGDWVEFADKIRTFYRWLRAHGHADKPFMLGEYGSDEPLAGQPGKRAWFLRARNALSGASNGGRPRFPNLKALVYFDSDRTGESGCAWHVDSSAAAVAGFRALGADPWFALPGKR